MTETFVYRVREKLQRLRESGMAPYGSEFHKFILNPTLSEAEVSSFEAKHGIRLPTEYRDFLRFVGNGGVGPLRGLLRLSRGLPSIPPDGFELGGSVPRGDRITPSELLATPFPHTTDCDPYDVEPRLVDIALRVQQGLMTCAEAGLEELLLMRGGTLNLCDQGCNYYDFLVVTGPDRGQVWVDAIASDQGYLRTGASFGEWYEAWLDRVLDGHPC